MALDKSANCRRVRSSVQPCSGHRVSPPQIHMDRLGVSHTSKSVSFSAQQLDGGKADVWRRGVLANALLIPALWTISSHNKSLVPTRSGFWSCGGFNARPSRIGRDNFGVRFTHRERFTFSEIHCPRDFSPRIASSLSHVSGAIDTERVTTERPVLGRPAPSRFPPRLDADFFIAQFSECFGGIIESVACSHLFSVVADDRVLVRDHLLN
mgnify:CR=1 FL=1